jgi:hypothetical protein
MGRLIYIPVQPTKAKKYTYPLTSTVLEGGRHKIKTEMLYIIFSIIS